MSVHSGPPLPKRTRMQHYRKELRLLRRDGIMKYLRIRRLLRRFHRIVDRMDGSP